MTVTLGPPPSWVRLDLDTHGPVLTVHAPGVVQPPDPLEVSVAADEPLAGVSAVFVAQDGSVTTLGVEIDGSTALLLMPTVGMGSGRGTLRITARDLAGNPSTTEVPVLIDRPRPYDLSADTIGVFDMTTSPDAAFELSTEVGRSFDLTTRADGAFETDAVTTRPFDLLPETTDG